MKIFIWLSIFMLVLTSLLILSYISNVNVYVDIHILYLVSSATIIGTTV